MFHGDNGLEMTDILGTELPAAMISRTNRLPEVTVAWHEKNASEQRNSTFEES
jgi:hypothetical protein